MSDTSVYPFGIDFQTKIISLIAKDPKFLDNYQDVINPNYFSNNSFVIIVQSLMDYFRRYKSTPTLDVLQELLLSYIKKVQLDASLATELTITASRIYEIDVTDIDFIRDKVVDFGKNHAMRIAVIESAKIIQNNGNLIEVRNLVDKACHVGTGISDYGIELFKNLEHLPDIALQSDTFTHKVPTGWPTIDKAYFGGLGAGELGIINGGSGQGKSMLLVNMIASAIERGVTGVYITHELSEIDVLLRITARLTGMTIQQILDPTYRQKFNEVISNILKYKHYLRVKYMPPRITTPMHIRAYISRLESIDGVRVGLLIDDYADRLSPALKGIDNTDTYRALGSITDDLILIGKDFKFPVWTGSQLNRSGYFAQNPGSEMTSDSMMKIFNCDCSIVMQQTREEREAGKMRGLIDKARRGVAQVHINWQVDYEHMLVTEAPANQ
jgi:replicative DNA helicase